MLIKDYHNSVEFWLYHKGESEKTRRWRDNNNKNNPPQRASQKVTRFINPPPQMVGADKYWG